ncbi:hypothetical protein niasHS_013359 [Heterodera schachtii]|uniref:Uncharacterized protein n=1 Tax=Heterodera schachtii TaxID=97005 RepID=A0ABD2I7N4_HETSC
MRGLYRELSAASIASPISWGLYLQFYDRIRAQLHTVPDWPIVDNLLAGSVTGALILSVTNPLWVCKTRMCLQYEAPRLYKGVLAGTVKQLPYSVITYIVYEQTRYAIRNMSSSE